MLQCRATSEIEKRAESELGETKEVVETSLNHVREWISQQSFCEQLPGDVLLLNFLRGSKFNLNKAKDKLTHYFTINTHVKEIFENRDSEREELAEVVSKGILTTTSSQDIEILVIRWHSCDTKKIALVNVLKLGFMLFDIFINESQTFMVTGHTVIIDCHNLPFSYVKQIFPTLIKDIAYAMFKAYPTRIKAVHVVNCCALIPLAFNMFKPFLPSKMISRVRFYNHRNASDIENHIPLSVLPKEYGGQGESIDTLKEKTKNLLKEKKTWFLNEEKRVVKEGPILVDR